LRGIGGLTTAENLVPSPAITENPLARSGLALAGANRRDSMDADGEDGILTAEEIAGMDLRGVRWAVLSACDTGIGQVTAGEGVFGLRRAFQVAGASTVIMSLWSVGDVSALDWMKALYRFHLEQGLPAAEAVREASLQVLTDRRGRGESTHPVYWGGWIAVGDNR
jgi:CHAT domain-containing protein